VLWQNDQFGHDLYKGIQKGLGDLNRMIVVASPLISMMRMIDGHVSILKRSGGEDFDFCGRADHGLAGRAAGRGFPVAPGAASERCGRLDRLHPGTGCDAIHRRGLGGILKGSRRPRMEGRSRHEGMAVLHGDVLSQGDKSSTAALYGYAAAETLVQVLKQCWQRSLARQHHATGDFAEELCTVGPVARHPPSTTGPADYRPIKQMRLVQLRRPAPGSRSAR
jgi:hypothetical protein